MAKVNKKRILTSAALIAGITLCAGLGAIKTPDRWLQDKLCQQGEVSSGDIIIIGLDERALAEFGPYNTWDRSIMASALESLAKDPDNKPAVVAVDTLYIGNTSEENDKRLAEAASKLDVVTAAAAKFKNDYSIVSFEYSYDELRTSSVTGHINAMEDTDGVMRHAILYVEPEGDRIYSMAYETARIYMEKNGSSIAEPETNSRGQFYLPFTAGPETYYDNVSIKDLIDGTVPSDYYANKIVLIGPYAAGLQDAYVTPISKSKLMNGVEIQANVIQSFIDSNFKKEVSTLPQLVALVLVLALCAYLFSNKKVYLPVIFFLVICGIDIAATIGLYGMGLVIHPLWIIVGASILLIEAIIEHYSVARREKAEVTKTFERYVAPEIVSEILKEGTDALALGGKNCDIAVLFVDVRGFTTMSERLAPEKVVYILNRYLKVTATAIENNSGTLDKFVGDATMAFWGAPLPNENSIYLACKTALEIIEGAEALNEKLKEEIGEELHVGVGVHYGPAVVGNMGSEKRMDYTAIGDTVNTSARLEANAPGGKVYISRIVADALGDKAKTKSLGGTVRLKGKAEGFEVLELEALEEM